MLVAIIGDPMVGHSHQNRIVTIERLSTTIPDYDESLPTRVLFNINAIKRHREEIMNTHHTKTNIIIDVPTFGDIPKDVRTCVDVFIMTDEPQAIWCMTQLNLYPDPNNNMVSITFANDYTQQFLMFDRKTRRLRSFGIPSV